MRKKVEMVNIEHLGNVLLIASSSRSILIALNEACRLMVFRVRVQRKTHEPFERTLARAFVTLIMDGTL